MVTLRQASCSSANSATANDTGAFNKCIPRLPSIKYRLQVALGHQFHTVLFLGNFFFISFFFAVVTDLYLEVITVAHETHTLCAAHAFNAFPL